MADWYVKYSRVTKKVGRTLMINIDRNIHIVTVKSMSFYNIRSSIIKKLESSRIQNRTEIKNKHVTKQRQLN